MKNNISFLFRDRGSTDDCIGTAFINLSAIAGQGDSSEGKRRVAISQVVPFDVHRTFCTLRNAIRHMNMRLLKWFIDKYESIGFICRVSAPVRSMLCQFLWFHQGVHKSSR